MEEAKDINVALKSTAKRQRNKQERLLKELVAIRAERAFLSGRLRAKIYAYLADENHDIIILRYNEKVLDDL